MRRAIRDVLDDLLARSAPGGEITLDAIGDALGTVAASHDEIDGLIAGLEAEGRVVGSKPGGDGEATLREVLAAARTIKDEGGQPTPRGIADRTGLPLDRVRHALALARVMTR
jgi:hypothetical protein